MDGLPLQSDLGHVEDELPEGLPVLAHETSVDPFFPTTSLSVLSRLHGRGRLPFRKYNPPTRSGPRLRPGRCLIDTLGPVGESKRLQVEGVDNLVRME